MEMPQLLGLSYQVIPLQKGEEYYWQTVRMQEAECVNSQVMPCNAVPSGWPVSVLRHTSWNAAVLGKKSLFVCVADSYHSLNSELCAEYFYTCHMFVCYFPCVCCTCTVVPLVGLY